MDVKCVPAPFTFPMFTKLISTARYIIKTYSEQV